MRVVGRAGRGRVSFALEALDLLLLLLDPLLLARCPLALLGELALGVGAALVVLALAP